MATTGERRILGFLVAMALIGAGVRALGVQRFEQATLGRSSAPLPAGAARALAAQRAAVDSARRAPRATRSRARSRASPGGSAETSGGGPASGGSGRAASRRPAPRFPIDVNAASAAELEALPRVGPAMARRIVERRERAGPYQSLDDLRHVRGIGPATLRLLDPLVTFSGRHRPLHSGEPPPPEYHPAYVFGRKSRLYGCSCCPAGESLG